jgi:hypothetical protein
MKLKHFFFIGVCSIVVMFSMSFLVAEAQNVSASASSNTSSISFPIAELGNCSSMNDCKNYCDKQDNIEACLDYALKNDLTSEKQVEVIKNKTKIEGPGGCTERKQCESYCEKEENFDECVAFAEKNKIISPEESKLAKKLGPNMIGPGGCKGKDECKAYCDNPDKQEECLVFSEKNGLISKEEAVKIKKMGPIKEGPGGCKGKKECDNYCGNPVNAEECVAFAEKNGLISPEEAKKMKKFVPNAEGPGGCHGPKECKAFCDKPDNQETCLAFAEKYELMSKEELEQARKMGPLKEGPGGCNGKEECDAFCGNPDNQETCMNFSVEHGLMSKEQAEVMKQGPSIKGGPGGCQGKDECDNFCQKPENMETCINFSVENGFMSKDEADRVKQGVPPITPNGNCKDKEENCPAVDAPGTPFNEKDCEGDNCPLKVESTEGVSFDVAQGDIQGDKTMRQSEQPKQNSMMQKFKKGIGVMKKFISPDDPDVVPNCKGDECKIKLEQVENEDVGEDGQATQSVQSSNTNSGKPQGMMQKFKKFISPDDPNIVPNCKGDECKIKLEQVEDEGVGGAGQAVQPGSASKQMGNSEDKAVQSSQPTTSGKPQGIMQKFKKFVSPDDPDIVPNCKGDECKIKLEQAEDEGVGEEGKAAQPGLTGKQNGNSESGQAEKPTQPSNSKFGQPNKQVMPLKPYNKIPSGDPALAPNCQGNDCKINIKPAEQPGFNNKAQLPSGGQPPKNETNKAEQ